MNYKDWLSMLDDDARTPGQLGSEQIELDVLFLSTVNDGLAWEGIEFPREWPSHWINGAIPEYTGTGWMYDVFLNHPPMSYVAKDIVHMSVIVYDYDPLELDVYIANLLPLGFEEVENDRTVRGWIVRRMIERARSFRCGDCTLVLLFGFGSGDEIVHDKPFIQFNLNFDRDPYIPDLTPTAGTEFLNAEQWDALTGDFEGKPPKMNDVGVSENADGMLYEMILHPSQWPKEFMGNLIPEYIYPAMLYHMQYVLPAESPSPEEALDIVLTLTKFLPEHIDEYARELVQFGYREVMPEDYTQQDISLTEHMLTRRVFTHPSLRVYLTTSEVEGFEQLLDIFMRFVGR